MNQEEVSALKEDFAKAAKIIEALSSNIRRDIILALVGTYPKGIRLGEIKSKKCISRPTISHHIKLLYKAGLIQRKKVGTKNYYSLAFSESDLNLIVSLTERLKKYVGDADASSH